MIRIRIIISRCGFKPTNITGGHHPVRFHPNGYIGLFHGQSENKMDDFWVLKNGGSPNGFDTKSWSSMTWMIWCTPFFRKPHMR